MSDVLSRLGWRTLQSRRDIYLNTMVFKCLAGLVPSYLGNALTRINERHNHRTRSSHMGNVMIPFPKTEMGKRKFSFRGAQAWNNLPPGLKSPFPTKVKQFTGQLNLLFE